MNVYLVCWNGSPWTRDDVNPYSVAAVFPSRVAAEGYALDSARRHGESSRTLIWVRSGSTSSLRDQNGRRTGWYVEREPLMEGNWL